MGDLAWKGKAFLRMTLEMVLRPLHSHINMCMHMYTCTYRNIYTQRCTHTHIQRRMSMMVHTYNEHLGGRSRLIAINLRRVVYLESSRLTRATCKTMH